MYPLNTSKQLATYLKSLRKSRGVSQAALGTRIGVSGARIGAIEHDPGAVSLAQLLHLLHTLGARLSIEEVSARKHQRSNPPVPAGEW